jgi:hypothetical protein
LAMALSGQYAGIKQIVFLPFGEDDAVRLKE